MPAIPWLLLKLPAAAFCAPPRPGIQTTQGRRGIAPVIPHDLESRVAVSGRFGDIGAA